jgi:hypothetical protein
MESEKFRMFSNECIKKNVFLIIISPLFFIAKAESHSYREHKGFKILSAKDTWDNRGKIFLVGTYHRSSFDDLKEEHSEQIKFEESKKDYANLINKESRNLDIVLHEGSPWRSDQLTPTRSILKVDETEVSEHVRFDKDLYIIGWEDPIAWLMAQVAERVLNRSIELQNSEQNQFRKLRANLFYYESVLYRRNQGVLKFLRDAVARASPTKNIFLLMGGGHFTDPEFTRAFETIGRDYVIYQSEFIQSNVHFMVEEMKYKMRLENKSPEAILRIYEETRHEIKKQGGVTQLDLDSLVSLILQRGPGYGCDQALN